MFGIDSSELLLIALVALVVIGPKDLPRVMRMVGQWVGKGRAMTRHVRAGFDEMMRQAELDEMQKQWAAQNEAIMQATALPDLAAPYAAPEITPDPIIPAQAGTHDPEPAGQAGGVLPDDAEVIGSGLHPQDDIAPPTRTRRVRKPAAAKP